MPSLLNNPPLVEPISLAETKAHLRILHQDEDATVARLITAARRAVESRSGLCLITQNWSTFFDAWPNCGHLPIALAPIIAITDVKIYGDDDVAAVVDPAHYYLDRLSRPARLTIRNGRRLSQPARKLNGIEIGLNLGFGSTPEAVPKPIIEAILLLVGHWFSNRGEDSQLDEPLAVNSLLAPYRLVRL